MPGLFGEDGGPEDPLTRGRTLSIEVTGLAEVGALLGEENVGSGAVCGQLEGLARQLDAGCGGGLPPVDPCLLGSFSTPPTIES